MDSFPVAGNVLSEELWNGVAAAEVFKLIVIPLLSISMGITFGLPLWMYLGPAGVMLLLSGGAILFAPGSQSGFAYAKATLDYYFTQNSYYKRHARPKHADDMKVKDRSLVRQEYDDPVDILVASQQGELLDERDK
jgi:hypothetical protein